MLYRKTPPQIERERPGRMLRSARRKECLSQKQLAVLSNISQRKISDYEKYKRFIPKRMAYIFAKILNTASSHFIRTYKYDHNPNRKM